jgi:hypothetical protein
MIGRATYFVGVRQALEESFARRGFDVSITEVPTLPAASIRHRAARVLETLVEIRARYEASIHIVGHSTGELDARLAIAQGNAGLCAFDARGRIPDRQAAPRLSAMRRVLQRLKRFCRDPLSSATPQSDQTPVERARIRKEELVMRHSVCWVLMGRMTRIAMAVKKTLSSTTRQDVAKGESVDTSELVDSDSSQPRRSAEGDEDSALFPRRSPPRLLTAAARGGLEPSSGARLRRAYLHLSQSFSHLQPRSAFASP